LTSPVITIILSSRKFWSVLLFLIIDDVAEDAASGEAYLHLCHFGSNRFIDERIVTESTLIEKGTFEVHSGKLRTMMRFFASPQLRRNTLTLGLCLLAVLFALEAKTAWYGPAKGPGIGVQSQKARPADLPALVSHGVSTLPSVSFPLALIFLVSVAAIAWTDANFLRGVDVDCNHIPVSAASYFSPGLFFRPPPAS
jgi:hypothetical protein